MSVHELRWDDGIDEHGNRIWSDAIVELNPDPERDLPEESRRVIEPEEFGSGKVTLATDPRVIEYLATHPGMLHEALTPRQFEELIAELLTRFGYKVQLAPKGRDGGVDILAEGPAPLGRELVLAQCKRNSPGSKVGGPVVKQFIWEVGERKATRGLVVTTSSFSSVALKLIEERKYIVSGADAEHIQGWINQAHQTISRGG